MMNLEDIIESWKKDCELDISELGKESNDIPKLHSKYLGEFSNHRMKLRALRMKKSALQQTLGEYYRGDLNNPEDLKEINREPWKKALLKQDVINYVANDSEMIKINLKLAYAEEVVDILEQILKSLNNRSFTIKNSVEFIKFTNGA